MTQRSPPPASPTVCVQNRGAVQLARIRRGPVLDGGYITVPTGPGLGVEPIPEVPRELTTDLYAVTGGA
jgi:L-alanine-DL-glutamate epimerase-like enolase superfamily enzyme